MTDHDDEMRRLLGPVTPLAPPPGTFERITRTARRRRRLRAAAAVSTAAASVVVLAFGGLALRDALSQNTPSRPPAANRTATTFLPHPTGSGVATTGPNPVGNTPTTSPNQGSTPTRCLESQLKLAVGAPSYAGKGRTGLVIVLTNTSTSPCLLTGYPGVMLTNVSGQQLNAKRNGSVLWADPGDQVVTIPPGQSASAGLEWPNANTSGNATSCPAGYGSIVVTPPNSLVSFATQQLSTTIEICSASGAATAYVTGVTLGSSGPPLAGG